MKQKTNRYGIVVACAMTLAGLSSVSMAASGVWIGDGAAGGNDGGSWTNSAKWQSNTIADDSTSSADFSTIDITANTTVTLDGARTINSLNFGDTNTSTAFSWTLGTGTGTNTLTLAGTTPTITVGTLGASQKVTISANIGGTAGFTKAGAGTLVLSGANTTTGGYSGTTTVSAGLLTLASDTAAGDVSIGSSGTLNFDNISVNYSGNTSGQGKITKTNSASQVVLLGNGTQSGSTTLTDGTMAIGTGTNYGLGTGTLVLTGGRFRSSDNNSRTIANVLSMGSNNIAFGAAEGATTGLGDLTFSDTSGQSVGGNKTWTVNNATTVTFNNGFSGNSGWAISKAGNGNLVFGGNVGSFLAVAVGGGSMTLNGATNAYSGTTSVTAGTLIVNGAKTGTGTVSVSSGATLAGKGSIAGTATLNGTVSPGTAGTIGTLSFTATTATTLSSSSILAFDLNAANQTAGGTINDLLSITSTGAFTLAGTLNVTSSPLNNGTWRLINYSGSLTNNGLSLGTIPLVAGHTAQIVAGSGHVDLVVVPEPTSLGLLALGSMTLLKRRRRDAAID